MTSRVEAVAEILWHRYSPDHEDSWPSPNADEYRRVASDILSTLTTEPAASEGRQEAVRIGDAVLDWMVKFDLLDAGNEYYVSDVLAVLNDLTPSTHPSEQAVTEGWIADRKMIAEAAADTSLSDSAVRALCLLRFGKVTEEDRGWITAVLKAAMEARR